MIRHWLHEWQMRRRIRAILRYNRKHPEQCVNLGEMWQQSSGSGIVSRETIETLWKYALEHGELL